jgi:TPR repeat protein
MKLSLTRFPMVLIRLAPVILISGVGGCAHPQAGQAAAEKGDTRAEYELAERYVHGNGVPQDYSKATEYFSQSAGQGYAPAQAALGSCYARGLGVKQDYSKALQWYCRAAAQGDALAQYCLGYAYAHGKGVPTNFDAAVEWWKKSAEQGQVYAQNALGQFYFGGEFPGDTNHINYAAAAKWLRKAAERGSAPAMGTLGYMYQYGVGVGHDWQQALKWNRQAAELGDATAQDDFGLMYENGNAGLPCDLVQAYKWFWLSRQQGDTGGRHDAMEIEVHHSLSPGQIDEAKHMAAQFQAQTSTNPPAGPSHLQAESHH